MVVDFGECVSECMVAEQAGEHFEASNTGKGDRRLAAAKRKRRRSTASGLA